MENLTIGNKLNENLAYLYSKEWEFVLSKLVDRMIIRTFACGCSHNYEPKNIYIQVMKSNLYTYCFDY